MPWYIPNIPESIKKRVCIYLIQRYLGQFFEQKLNLDQLTIDLYDGTATLTDINLDVQALNELGERQNWPMEFVDGYLEKLFINVPWSAILSASTVIEVSGLQFTVQPKQRNEEATSMFESMWSSMSSSMQMAQECMTQNYGNTAADAQPYEGIEKFAQTIDSVLSRIKVKFVNTSLQVEHVPKDSLNGTGIRIDIDNMEYTDEAGNDQQQENVQQAASATTENESAKDKTFVESSFTTKKLLIEGINIYTVEFPLKARTYSRSRHSISEEDDDKDNLVQEDDKNEEIRHEIPFIKVRGKQEMYFRMKNESASSSSWNSAAEACDFINSIPKVSIELNVGAISCILSPRQVHLLMELCRGFSQPDLEDSLCLDNNEKSKGKKMTELDYQRIEQDLQQRMLNANLNQQQQGRYKGLKGMQGWSSSPSNRHHYDEEDEDDEEDIKFYPMTMNLNESNSNSNIMFDSTTSSLDSMSTYQSNSTANKRKSMMIRNIENDPSAEISHFQIRIFSLNAIVLHENMLVCSTTDLCPNLLLPSSVQQMKKLAENYLNCENDEEEKCSVVLKGLNHLKVEAGPIQLNGDEASTLTAFSINANLTIGDLKIVECLKIEDQANENQKSNNRKENAFFENIPILSFNDNKKNTKTKPCLNLNMSHRQQKNGGNSKRMLKCTKTDVVIKLEACTIDFDITIVDRINALLNPIPICIVLDNDDAAFSASGTSRTRQCVDLALEKEGKALIENCVKINSRQIVFKLRFPIPDFRLPHDMNKVPWWKRNVRSDYLALKFIDCSLEHSFSTNQSESSNSINSSANSGNGKSYSILSKQILLHYYEKSIQNEENYVDLGRFGSYYNKEDLLPTKISVRILPVKSSQLASTSLVEDEEDVGGMKSSAANLNAMTQSFYGSFPEQVQDNGPFSKFQTVFQSTVGHNSSPLYNRNCKSEDDNNADNKGAGSNAEPMVYPGEKEEIDEFITTGMESARIQIVIDAPQLNLMLPNKHIYEVIYNRINNDLLLWEPSAPKISVNNSDFSAQIQQQQQKSSKNCNYLHQGGDEEEETFSLCKSGSRYYHHRNSDSDHENNLSRDYYKNDNSHDEEEDEEQANILNNMSKSGIFYSAVYDSTNTATTNPNSSNANTSTNPGKKEDGGNGSGNDKKQKKQSFLGLNIKVNRGTLVMHPPCRDTSSSNNVIPSHRGNFVFDINNAKFCLISAYKGDQDLSYLCFATETVILKHNGMVMKPTSTIFNDLQQSFSRGGESSESCSYFHCPDNACNKVYDTIYPSEPGVVFDNGKNGGNRDMFSVAVRILDKHETHNVKTVRVSVALNKATLYHRAALEPNTWISQLIDMFNVDDYQIPGYSPKGVLTELYLNVFDSAIDYRPKYLPLKTVITIGDFTMSSHLAATANASNLRFIVEFCSLFLSEDNNLSKNVTKNITRPNINLKEDYVCLMEFGLFEISLLMMDATSSNKTKQRLDLKASSDSIHIRTCADSARALMQLITYFANDGDLTTNNPTSANNSPLHLANSSANSSQQGVDELITTLAEEEEKKRMHLNSGSGLSKSQHEQIENLIGDAIDQEDLPLSLSGSASASASGNLSVQDRENVFLFPDEASCSSSSAINKQVVSELGNVFENRKRRDTTNSDGGNNTDDEFCIIDESHFQNMNIGVVSFGSNKQKEPSVNFIGNGVITFNDSYFNDPPGNTIDVLKTPKSLPTPVYSYSLCDLSIIWHLYGGNDFSKKTTGGGGGRGEGGGNKQPQNRGGGSRDKESGLSSKKAVNFKVNRSDGLLQRDADGEVASVSFVNNNSNAIVMKKNNATSPSLMHLKTKGGPGRDCGTLMELEMKKIKFKHEEYPDNSRNVLSRQVLVIGEVEIRDRLASSELNKFMHEFVDDKHPKCLNSKQVTIKAYHVNEEDGSKSSKRKCKSKRRKRPECALRISIAPIRLHIDQDALLFLINFFTELGQQADNQDLNEQQQEAIYYNYNYNKSNESSPLHCKQAPPPPILSIEANDDDESEDDNEREGEGENKQKRDKFKEAKLIGKVVQKIDENLLLLVDEDNEKNQIDDESMQDDDDEDQEEELVVEGEEDAPIFFKTVFFTCVLIRLDYQGKSKIDMKHGPLTGLLMGLGQLNCSQFELIELHTRQGILGFDKLMNYMLQEWLKDIKKNQIPSLLCGVGPINSLIQIFYGIRDLFWLPIEQYQKDGRIVRGLQRGANSFTTSTAMAALELTTRVIHIIKITAETAFDMVNPGLGYQTKNGRQDGESGASGRRNNRRRRRYNSNQPPADIREGMANAYLVVKEGIGETASNLLEVAAHECEQKGYSGAVGGVLRQIPPTIVKPIIMVSEATNNVLGGMRSQLVPDVRMEAKQKWRQQE